MTSEVTDNTMIKLKYPNSSSNNSTNSTNSTTSTTKIIVRNPYQYLFITDKGNHCIRRVDVLTAEVTTYAGICTHAGFKDGPTGTNRFNSPDGLGIDDDGNLYVYDSGNRYIRLITTDGYVTTLINGACFGYNLMDSSPNSFSVNNQYILCLKNWVKTSGLPSGHILAKTQTVTCNKLSVECTNIYNSTLVLNRTDSLYGIDTETNNTSN